MIDRQNDAEEQMENRRLESEGGSPIVPGEDRGDAAWHRQQRAHARLLARMAAQNRRN